MRRGWRWGVVELPCINLGERCQRDHDCRHEQRSYLSCTAFHLRENTTCALNTQLQKTKRQLPPLPSAQTQEIAPVLLLHRFHFSIRLSLLTERRLDSHKIRSVNFEESVTQARLESTTRSMTLEDELAQSLHRMEGVELYQKAELL